MATRRVITGTGRATNAHGDEITVQLGFSEGTLIVGSAPGLYVGHFGWTVRGKREYREFESGAEARKHGDTFGGCDVARRAAQSINPVFLHRSLDDALSVKVADLIEAMGGVDASGRACVATVLEATQRAVTDVRTRILAEEIVESRRARVVK